MKELLPRGCQSSHGIHGNSEANKPTPELPSISSSHSSLVGLLRDSNEDPEMADPTQNCGQVTTPVPRPCTCHSAIVLKPDQEGKMDLNLANWLTRCVHFTKSIPDISKLPHKDQVLLLTSAWKELVLLYMAQNGFDFDFMFQSQIHHTQHDSGSSGKHHDCVSRLWIEGVPTIKSVEQLRFILRKFAEMQPDDKEYAVLRLLLLLNADLRGLSNMASVESSNERAHTALMEYESIRYSSNPLRLSHLLLLLPGVRGFSTRVFENLFYHHLVGDTTVESVLVQLLSD
ncbi:retinoic acid receptor RXR-gamma-like isoform X2 [Amphiura filiformis]